MEKPFQPYRDKQTIKTIDATRIFRLEQRIFSNKDISCHEENNLITYWLVVAMFLKRKSVVMGMRNLLTSGMADSSR